MKRLILSLILGGFALSGYAQMNTFGGIGLRVKDTVTYQTNAAAYHAQGYSDIYYNWQATTRHYDIWNGSSYDHIFNFASGSGGGGTWGSITGTLSAQTDLQSALDAKQDDITFGTGVQTALGVNVGSAGSVVVNGGALGTPSSGTLTNATGYLLNNIANPTGTTTLALSTNPLIFSTGVTTGTGATAGIQLAANSLTTGNAFDVSSSSLTTGAIAKFTSTTTAINHTAGSNGVLSVISSGANANASRTTVGGNFVVTNTGTTSTNYGAYFSASGATTNYSAVFNESFLVGNARANTIGTNNLFFGNGSGNLSISAGNRNVGIGTNTFAAASNLVRSVAVGYEAGKANINGFDNTYVGDLAGTASTGSANTFIGKSAGLSSVGAASATLVGANAGQANVTGSITAMGRSTLVNSTGTSNTAFGQQAGNQLTTGTANTFVGANANGDVLGKSPGSGTNNNLFGVNAGFNLNGSRNFLAGVEAGSNLAGSDNVVIGNSASDFTIHSSANDQNTVLGAAGWGGGSSDSTSGDRNTFLGYNVATSIDGDQNVFVGANTGTASVSGSGSILIGYDVEAASTTASNQLNIQNIIYGTANSGTGSTLSTGDIGIGVTAPAAKFDILQTALTTTGGKPIIKFKGGAHTLLTASTEQIDLDFDLARTVQFNTGTLALQRGAYFRAPTYSFFAASTITKAATVSIAAPIAGTNATITTGLALDLETGSLALSTAGGGILIKTGTNATVGTGTLVGGTLTVNTTKVTANSMILVTSQSDGGAPGFLRVTARTGGTSFTITSSSGTDTSTFAWWILEPAP